MSVDDLIAFLRARLDERERRALDLNGEVWRAATDVGDEYNVGVVAVGRGDALVNPLDTVVARCGVEGVDDGEVRAAHIADHDPAWVLRDVEAKRQIVDWYAELTANPQRLVDVMLHLQWTVLGYVVRALASGEDAHPDYQPEWRT